MTTEEPRSLAGDLVTALEATLRDPRAAPFEVRDIADMVVGLAEDDLASALAASHPVTQAFVWSGYRRLSPRDGIEVLIAAATDPEARAMARTALMATGQPEINELVALWRRDVGAGTHPEVTDIHSLLQTAELDPQIPWAPERFRSMEQIPERLRPLFPLEDMPAYQYYCSLIGTFEFPENEMDMLELIRSAGHTEIEFDGADPIRVADAGVEVAFDAWAVWGQTRRDAEARGDVGGVALATERVRQAVDLFANSIRDGANLSVGLALVHPEDFRNLYATFADALAVVSAEGTREQLAQAVREAKVLLANGMPSGLEPEAVASYDQLRAQVDMFHKLELFGGPQDGFDDLGPDLGPGPMGR